MSVLLTRTPLGSLKSLMDQLRTSQMVMGASQSLTAFALWGVATTAQHMGEISEIVAIWLRPRALLFPMASV